MFDDSSFQPCNLTEPCEVSVGEALRGDVHVNMAQVKSLAGAALASSHSAGLRIKHSHKISSR